MAKQKLNKSNEPVAKKVGHNFFSGGEIIYSLLIFAFAFLLYFNSIFNDYNMDDELVTQNHRLTSKGISAIPEIFSSPYYEDKAGYKYEYRPVVIASFAIEHSLFGEHAPVSHFINVLLYALLCVVLFSVLRKLFKQYNILFPFMVTLFFTAHPIHTEVVASIKNRDEIFSLLFGLFSLKFAIQFGEKKKVLYLVAMSLLFLFGILSKTTVITFVLLIPVSLILLSQIPFGYLLAITISLAVPAVFFARLYSLTQQIGLFFLLLVSVIILYSIKNAKQIFIEGKRIIHENFNWKGIETKSELSIEHSIDFSFFKNLIQLIPFTILVLISLAIALAGVKFGNSWMTVIPLLGLALLYVFVREELKLLLITPVTLIALFAIIKFQFSISAVETLLLIFLGGNILNKNKPFKIVGIGNYLFYALAMVTANHSLYFLTGLLFIVMLHKRSYFLSYVMALVLVAVYAKIIIDISVGHISIDISLISLPILISAVVLIWRQKINWIARGSVLLIPVMLGLYLMVSSYRQTDVIGGLQKKYFEINEIKATDLTPVQAVRPLGYMEIPISNTDPLTIRLGTAMLVLGKYLKLILVPYPMSFYYGYAYISPMEITDTVPVISLLLYLIIAGAALFFLKKEPVLSFSILFYLVAISVFSNLVIPIPGMMGDRFLFIPSVGFCVLFVFILSKIFKEDWTASAVNWKTLKQPLKISFTAVLVLYSLLTFSRNMDWKNRITLFSHDINVVENSAQAQNLLGLHLYLSAKDETDLSKQKQMLEQALTHLKKAVEIYPQFLNASFDRARILDAMHRYDEALDAYRQTALIDSNFSAPSFSMAIILQNQGNLSAAIPLYEKCLLHHNTQMEVYANLSFAYFNLKQYDKSIATNMRALQVEPNAFDPTVNIAKTYKQINERDSAIYYFEKAQLLRPNDPNLATAIADLKNKK